MLEKVISGGQTGVDRAALLAAQTVGVPTGGWAPKGWLTKDGPAPALLRGFGLVECSGGYRERTYWNVRDSDATLRIAADFTTPGERCTLNAIRRYQKPYEDVWWQELHAEHRRRIAQDQIVFWWRTLSGAKVLNVAGNTEGTHGLTIGPVAVAFLVQLFTALRKEGR